MRALSFARCVGLALALALTGCMKKTAASTPNQAAAHASYPDVTTAALLAPGCQSCHVLPALTGPYCATVLTDSVLGPALEGGARGAPTMPPAGENRDDYEDDIRALMDACEQVYDAEAAAEAAKYGSSGVVDFFDDPEAEAGWDTDGRVSP